MKTHPEFRSTADKRYADPFEVERITGIPRSTLAKRRVYGDGPPFVKIGAKVLYDIDELKDWLAALPRRTSTSDPGAS
jgi:hypothetical protein